MNRQIIVPVVGRIQHVTMDESREIVSSTAEPEKTTPEELAANGLVREDIYIHHTFTDDIDIWSVMRQKADEKEKSEKE